MLRDVLHVLDVVGHLLQRFRGARRR